MQLVKVKDEFYSQCRLHGTDDELMFNESGRPCVLILRLLYKGKRQEFVVPLRSNISSKAPKWQYLSLPPNARTRTGNAHGIHYIKIFPINKTFIDNFLIDGDLYMIMIKSIIDRKEKEIIVSCQKYLQECEKGNKHIMTPDIDGILSWLK